MPMLVRHAKAAAGTCAQDYDLPNPSDISAATGAESEGASSWNDPADTDSDDDERKSFGIMQQKLAMKNDKRKAPAKRLLKASSAKQARAKKRPRIDAVDDSDSDGTPVLRKSVRLANKHSATPGGTNLKRKACKCMHACDCKCVQCHNQRPLPPTLWLVRGTRGQRPVSFVTQAPTTTARSEWRAPLLRGHPHCRHA